ncbi:AI-2E family transporter [Actinokineospora xionganensis]|uniref:AI-2E family transporter n=1 Tax=Actinokineospora xionganensis TaxID=2684470 RepID=A0ABR7KZN1_9PSEU|nr:AI-2E family transporter [Actinokineospora xionganensis]MBC6445886.1 AI-2E family transporter [Actinokineospora xionganensis]
MLIFLAIGYVALRVVLALAAVLIPLAIAVLLAALLAPVAQWLVRRGCARWLAAALVLLGSLTVLGGLFTLTVNALITGAGDLGGTLRDGVMSIRDWLVTGPLGLSERQMDAAVDDLVGLVGGQAERIVSGASTTAAAIGAALAGLVLTLFALFFFLYDGERIWAWVLTVTPDRVRARVDDTGRLALSSLGGFTRATLVVATVDAVAIGVGLLIIGVPMVVPLASLVFLAAFVPYVGAFFAGFVAVLVALVSGGPVMALATLLLSVAVQELEGEVLQPFLLSRAVRLHPLAVVFAVAAGVVLAGIVGALLAVPVVLVVRAALDPRGAAEPETPRRGALRKLWRAVTRARSARHLAAGREAG